MSKHDAAKAETIVILERALNEAKERRSYDYLAALKEMGFTHTYENHYGRKVWEPSELTADNDAKGTKGILGARFFTLYESNDARFPWLNFIVGRIGNTSNYILNTEEMT